MGGFDEGVVELIWLDCGATSDKKGLGTTGLFHSAFLPDIYSHSHISWLSFLACLKPSPPVIMSQTDELGVFGWGYIFPNRVKSAPNVILQKGLETQDRRPGQTHEKDDPIHLWISLKNNPDETKWDLALTAHSSLETISPIIHMTCVSGMVSNKGCIMNSLAWWTPHNENALQSCQACCFNGLISEAIIVNTSQRRHLEHSGEVAWSTLVLVAYWLICEGRWVMTRKSEWQRPSLGKRRNIGDIILNEAVRWTRTGVETTLYGLTTERGCKRQNFLVYLNYS